jgi:hypothetical protein
MTIKEEIYSITPYDRGTFLCEKRGTDEANIIDVMDVTCSCQDFHFRAHTFKNYACKHLKMVVNFADLDKPVKVKRTYNPKTKKEEVKALE